MVRLGVNHSERLYTLHRFSPSTLPSILQEITVVSGVMSKHSHAYDWLFIAGVCVLSYADGPSLSIVIVPVDKIASEKLSQLNKRRHYI